MELGEKPIRIHGRLAVPVWPGKSSACSARKLEQRDGSRCGRARAQTSRTLARSKRDGEGGSASAGSWAGRSCRRRAGGAAVLLAKRKRSHEAAINTLRHLHLTSTYVRSRQNRIVAPRSAGADAKRCDVSRLRGPVFPGIQRLFALQSVLSSFVTLARISRSRGKRGLLSLRSAAREPVSKFHGRDVPVLEMQRRAGIYVPFERDLDNEDLMRFPGSGGSTES